MIRNLFRNLFAVDIWKAAGENDIKYVGRWLDGGGDINSKNEYGNTPLHYSCYDGHNETIKLLIERGADIHAKNKNGYTPLHYACRNGRNETINLLIERGADIHAKNRNGYTPLHYACRNGHNETINLLIERGADINAKNNDGKTPLDLALKKDTRNLLFDLMKDDGLRGIDIWNAAREGDIVSVGQWLDGGGDINTKSEVGDTPLHVACGNGHNETIKLLIERGADIHAKNKYVKTPLDLSKNEDTRNLLLDLMKDDGLRGLVTQDTDISRDRLYELVRSAVKQSNPALASDYVDEQISFLCKAIGLTNETVTMDRETYLKELTSILPQYRSTSVLDDLNIIHYLVFNEADENIKGIDIWKAAENNDTKSVGQWLDEGRDVNIKTGDGFTPLHIACIYGHNETIKLLIERGVDIHAKNMYGDTPLHDACRNGHNETIKLLIERGANINAKNNYGDTPLHEACKYRRNEIINLLIERGADINAKNNDGKTPLDLALKKDTRNLLFDLMKDDGLRGIDIWNAAREGDIVSVGQWLDGGGDINTKSEYGNTPLHVACFKGHNETINLLIERGADIHAKNKDGKTPLELAKNKDTRNLLLDLMKDDGLRGLVTQDTDISRGQLSEVVRSAVKQSHPALASDYVDERISFLCIAIGLINETDTMDRGTYLKALTSILHLSRSTSVLDDLNIIRNLLLNVADENMKDIDIWEVAREGDIVSVGQWLDGGGDVNIKTEVGDTPLHVACQYGHNETSKLLIERGADIHAKDNYGDTPLHDASCNGHNETIKLLIERGADINAKNKYGKTPLDLSKNEDTRNLLLSLMKNNGLRGLVTQDTDISRGQLTELVRSAVKQSHPALASDYVDERISFFCRAIGLINDTDTMDRETYLKALTSILPQSRSTSVLDDLNIIYDPAHPSQAVVGTDTHKHGVSTNDYYHGSLRIDIDDEDDDSGFPSHTLKGYFSYYNPERNRDVKVNVIVKTPKSAAVSLKKEGDVYNALTDDMPRVPTFYTFNEDCEYLIIQKFGQNLHGCLKHDKNILRAIAVGIIRAVEFMHGKGFVHCDIKPANILVDINAPDVKVKLCDLSAATKIGDPVTTSLTSRGWQAPEVYFASISNKEAIATPAIDIFSAGLVIAYMFHSSDPIYLETLLPDELLMVYTDQNTLNKYTFCTSSDYVNPFIQNSMCILDPAERATIDEAIKYFDLRITKLWNENEALKKKDKEHKNVVDLLTHTHKAVTDTHEDAKGLIPAVGNVKSQVSALLIRGNEVPTTMIVVPNEFTSNYEFFKGFIQNPKLFTGKQCRVFFVCAQTHRVVPSGPDGHGLVLTVSREWFRDASPYLKLGLLVVKIGLGIVGADSVAEILPSEEDLTPERRIEYLANHFVYLDLSGSSEAGIEHNDRLQFVNNDISFDSVTDKVKELKSQINHDSYLKVKAAFQRQGILENDLIIYSGLKKVVDKDGGVKWIDSRLQEDTFLQTISSDNKTLNRIFLMETGKELRTNYSHNATDVFLSHDWSEHTIERIFKIREALGSRAIVVYSESEAIRGDRDANMRAAIRQAKHVVVMLTKEYMQRVNSEDTNSRCRKEFIYATERASKNMIVVAMKEDVADASKWDGRVKLGLQGLPVINMSGDLLGNKVYLDRCIDRLSWEIQMKHSSSITSDNKSLNRKTIMETGKEPSTNYSHNATDVFMSHDWSEHTIKGIVKIREALGSRAIVVYSESEAIRGDRDAYLRAAIRQAKHVVVMLTKEYMQRVNSEDTNSRCRKEFIYATERASKNMIVVALENEAADASKWEGRVKLGLQGLTVINMSGDLLSDKVYLDRCIDRLSWEI